MLPTHNTRLEYVLSCTLRGFELNFWKLSRRLLHTTSLFTNRSRGGRRRNWSVSRQVLYQAYSNEIQFRSYDIQVWASGRTHPFFFDSSIPTLATPCSTYWIPHHEIANPFLSSRTFIVPKLTSWKNSRPHYPCWPVPCGHQHIVLNVPGNWNVQMTVTQHIPAEQAHNRIASTVFSLALR